MNLVNIGNEKFFFFVFRNGVVNIDPAILGSFFTKISRETVVSLYV